MSGDRSQGDVMRQTEQAIRRAMDKLRTNRPFVWEALELKKKLTMWQAQTAGLNILQAVGNSLQNEPFWNRISIFILNLVCKQKDGAFFYSQLGGGIDFSETFAASVSSSNMLLMIAIFCSIRGTAKGGF